MNKTANNTTFTKLINGEKPVLVDFYTDWCGPCKMMNPILKELKKMVGDRVNIVKVDAEKNPEASNKYKVMGVPTLILFQNGEIVWQQSGVVPAHKLKSILSQYIN